jgi:tRNA dimethylallyltransferase
MIVCIVGPTGIGKTKLSIELAHYFNTEIISGDSVQVYRDLNIGSAKIKKEEMEGIVHHLIDIVDPFEDFSVALFQKLVREKINELNHKGKMPLIVGGTGLYIKSVLYDYNFENAKRDVEFQEKYKNVSNKELHNILKERDFKTAEKLHPNNRKRVLQAIQRSFSNKVSENTNKDVPLYDFLMIGLRMDRKQLIPILNQRIETMIKDGLVEEVSKLYKRGVRSNAVQAIGYKELYKYFDGTITLAEAIEQIKIHTRRLAKKQDTFFRNQFPVHWIDVDLERFDNTVDEVIHLIKSKIEKM